MKIKRSIIVALLSVLLAGIIPSFLILSKGDEVPAKEGKVYAIVLHGRRSWGTYETAYRFYNSLLENKLPGYRTYKENIRLVGNKDNKVFKDTLLSLEDVDQAIHETLSQSTEDDLVIFYYAGHGHAQSEESKKAELERKIAKERGEATDEKEDRTDEKGVAWDEEGDGLAFGWYSLPDEKQEHWRGFVYRYDNLLVKLSNYSYKKIVIIIDACVAAAIKNEIAECDDEYLKSRLCVMTSTGADPKNDFNLQEFFRFTNGMLESSGAVKATKKNTQKKVPTTPNKKTPPTLKTLSISCDDNKDGVVNFSEAYNGAIQSPSLLYYNIDHFPFIKLYPVKRHNPYFFSNGNTSECPLFQFQYLEIDKKETKIYEGSENSFHLTAKKHYDMVDQHKIRWTSDNESIATVDQDGNVTGVSAGTATITAHLDTKEGVECLGAEDKCEVTVKKVSTEILQDSMYVCLGEKEKIDFKIEGPSKKCTWTSSDPSVATVKNGKVEGIKEGKVTVTLEANKKSDNILIEVLKPYIESDNLTLQKGESIKIPYVMHGPEEKIKFSSSDKSIVSVDKNGVATGHKVGTAQITMKAYKSKTIIEVRVVESKDKEESTSAVQGAHDEFGGSETVNGEDDEDSAAEEPDAENTPEQEHQQDQDLTMEGIGLAYGHYEGIKPQGDGAIPAEIDLYEDGTFRIYCHFDLFSPNSTEHTYTGTYTVDRINEDGYPVLLFRTDDREFEMTYDGRSLYHENFFFLIK